MCININKLIFISLFLFSLYQEIKEKRHIKQDVSSRGDFTSIEFTTAARLLRDKVF